MDKVIKQERQTKTIEKDTKGGQEKIYVSHECEGNLIYLDVYRFEDMAVTFKAVCGVCGNQCWKVFTSHSIVWHPSEVALILP